MKLIYDLDLQILRDGNQQALEGLTLRYKDQVPLTIQFLQGGNFVEPASVILVPVVKPVGKFDGDPLCPSVTFIKTGAAATAVWTGNLVVDSPAIEAALKDNGNEADDVASFPATFQIYAEADGGESRSPLLSTTVTNSLYRGSETFPVVVGGTGLYELTQDRIAVTNSTGNTTITPVPGRRNALVIVTISGAARTSNIVFDIAGRVLNDRLTARFNIPATAGIILDVKNATAGGTSLIVDPITTSGSAGQNLLLELYYDGTAWQRLGLNYPTL